MAKRVSFFKKKKIEKRISFRSANGKFVSFTAKVPSKKRTKITFFATKKAKIMVRSRRRGGRNNEIIVDGICHYARPPRIQLGLEKVCFCGIHYTEFTWC